MTALSVEGVRPWGALADAAIRLHHEDHDVVLGVPDNLVEYVAAA